MTNPYYPFVPFAAIGQVDPFLPPAQPVQRDAQPLGAMTPLYAALGTAGAAIGAYHGYKRNNSVGWAIGWALLGGLAPVIVIPVAFAQGLGKRGPK